MMIATASVNIDREESKKIPTTGRAIKRILAERVGLDL
jgi:hypothetical protein